MHATEPKQPIWGKSFEEGACYMYLGPKESWHEE